AVTVMTDPAAILLSFNIGYSSSLSRVQNRTRAPITITSMPSTGRDLAAFTAPTAGAGPLQTPLAVSAAKRLMAASKCLYPRNTSVADAEKFCATPMPQTRISDDVTPLTAVKPVVLAAGAKLRPIVVPPVVKSAAQSLACPTSP